MTTRPPPRAEPFDATLVAARALSENVRELVFERAGGAPLDFLPGQWVNVLLRPPDAEREGDVAEVKRAYSIASPPRGDGRFELAVTRVEGGPMSGALHKMDVGTTIRCVGPSGLFTRAPDDRSPALFVATGTGITPLRSMLLAAREARALHHQLGAPEPRALLDEGAPTTVLFGVRTEADILYRDEFEALAAAHPSVRLEVTLSRPSGAWRGRTGYVQTHARELWMQLGDDAARAAATAYVCGLDKMVKAVKDVLRNEVGVGRRQVQQERYD